MWPRNRTKTSPSETREDSRRPKFIWAHLRELCTKTELEDKGDTFKFPRHAPSRPSRLASSATPLPALASAILRHALPTSLVITEGTMEKEHEWVCQ